MPGRLPGASGCAMYPGMPSCSCVTIRATTFMAAPRRSCPLLDRDPPVDPVFFRRIVARRLVVRAPVVPDHHVALPPLGRIAALGPDLVFVQLGDHLVVQLLWQAAGSSSP